MLGDAPAGSSGSDVLAVGVGLLAAGLLTLVGGAFTVAPRRRRTLARRHT